MANSPQKEPEQEIPIYIWQPRLWEKPTDPPPFPPTGFAPVYDRGSVDLHRYVVEAAPRDGTADPPKKDRWHLKGQYREIEDPPEGGYPKHEDPSSEGRDQQDKVAKLFEFIVGRCAVFTKQFNAAYLMWKRDRAGAFELYQETRIAYLQFVSDLDDRHREGGGPDKKYSKPIKWVDVLPDIRTESAKWATEGPIQGVRVVVKWNPCSSSHLGYWYK